MMNLSTPLSDDIEQLVHRIIGCCIDVHRAMGPGLLERIYQRAVAIEFTEAGIPFELEKRYEVMYRGRLLCDQRVDFVVANAVLLEIKAQDRILPVHHSQILSYLRISRLKVGLLINFNVSVLPNGLKRFVLT